MEALDRHDRIVLQFSGGKDSIATLLLCEPWWHKILVAFANRGAEFPETLEVIRWARSLPIRFMEVSAGIDHERAMREHGYPVDMVPLKQVPEIAYLSGQPEPALKMQSFMACCSRMFWEPMDSFVRESGATLVVRGQRNDEAMKAAVRSGDTLDGIEYLFPVEQWSEKEVEAFIRDRRAPVPDHYRYTRKSLDCWPCTAYLHESRDQLAYLREFHPEKWAIVAPRLRAIRDAQRAELAHTDAACGLMED